MVEPTVAEIDAHYAGEAGSTGASWRQGMTLPPFNEHTDRRARDIHRRIVGTVVWRHNTDGAAYELVWCVETMLLSLKVASGAVVRNYRRRLYGTHAGALPSVVAERARAVFAGVASD